MALSAEQVAAKTFKVSMLWGGYDQAEVDDFLDEVQTELVRLQSESGRSAAGQPELAEQQLRSGGEPGTDPAGRSQQAMDLLSLAQHTAEECLAQARLEAEQVTTRARERATELLGEAAHRRDVTLGSLEQTKAELKRRIELLRRQESEYRQSLTALLEAQLEQLRGRDDRPGETTGTAETEHGAEPPPGQHEDRRPQHDAAFGEGHRRAA